MPAKIAILLPHTRPGGSESASRRLAERLAARGLEVDLLIATGEVDAEASGPPQVALGARRIATCPPALARYLRRERPAALFSALTHVNAAAVAGALMSRTGVRLVLADHSMPTHAKLSRFRRDRVLPFVPRLAYRRAHAVFAISDGVAEDLIGNCGVPPSLVRVVPTVVDIDEFRRRGDEPAGHPWLGPAAPPLLVAVGRLESMKDHATLLRAFARVRERTPACLLILGEGDERSRLEALAQGLGLNGEVELPGRLPNPAPYMRQAAVFVHSSASEGLPTVLIEALALGRKIVATDCSGAREILGGGRYGALVPPGDPAALADAIAVALADPSKPDLSGALDLYHPERVTDMHLAELLPGGSPA